MPVMEQGVPPDCKSGASGMVGSIPTMGTADVV